MSILISANINDMNESKALFKLMECFNGRGIGIEIFPMWHVPGFESRLKRLVPYLAEIPSSFHGPYGDTEHSAPAGSPAYNRSMRYMNKTIEYAAMIKARHIVFHHNNEKVSQYKIDAMIENSQANLIEITEKAAEAGVPVVVENAGIIQRGNMLFNESEFIDMCRAIPNKVLLDIGHANCNGWNIARVINALKDKIAAYHLHNNYGADDEHNPITAGTINIDYALHEIARKTPEAELILEYFVQGHKNIRCMMDDIERVASICCREKAAV